MLYEYRQNKLIGLQKSWSKNIGYVIEADSWNNIIKLPVTISVCNKFREMQFYIVHQAYVSPYRYRKQVSPNCMV